MAFDVAELAPFLFRAGYHAWRHMRAPDYPAIGAEAEARETKGALQEADQVASDYNGLDEGVKQAREHMESRDLEVKIKNGQVINLDRSLDLYFRSRGDKRLWGWWRAGLNAAALELLQEDDQAAGAPAEKAAIQKEFRDTREALKVALSVAGMSASDLEQFGVKTPGEACDAIREHLKIHHPLPGNPKLLRLRAQYSAGVFPDDALLMLLGCTVVQIDYLRLLFKRKPQAVSYEEAGIALNVTASAVAQRYREMPHFVRDVLIMDVGSLKKKAWRPCPQSQTL